MTVMMTASSNPLFSGRLNPQNTYFSGRQVSFRVAGAWTMTTLIGPHPHAYIATWLRFRRRSPAGLITGRCESAVVLHNKNPPTPCLWQAPASTQKPKRKTRPAIRRSARCWWVSRSV